MNKHKPAQNAKARHLCFTLLLWFHLVLGGVPGPCRHSVTKDHLFHLNRLIDNQLDNGCAISYLFTENQSLSKACYIKAVFPQILELLNTHFQYGKRSDNRRYVNVLKKVIYDIYSQRCIPEINEEIEDNPVKFLKVQNTSPKEALRKAKSVIQMYMALIKEQKGHVDWNCEEEYAGDYPETTSTALRIPNTDNPACPCSCPTLAQITPDAAVLSTSVWSRPPQTTLSMPISDTSPRPSTSQSTKNDDVRMSLTRPSSIGGSKEQIFLDGSSTNGDRATKMPRSSPPVTEVNYGPTGSSQDNFLVSEVDNITPATFLYDVAAPSSDDRIYVLAKRSLNARDYGIQQASGTDSYLPQVSKPYPQAKDTGVMYLDNLDYQKQEIGSIATEEGPYLKKDRKHLTELKITPRIAKTEPSFVWAVNSAVVIKEVQSIKEAEDPDVAFLQGASGVFGDTGPCHSERSMSSRIAVIITAVCAGVLLIVTLHCFRAKRRLHQALCHPPLFQNRRSHINTKGIELHCFETKE